ncbi:MAG: zinc ribbon domain-containing protein [Clostridium sp.]|uniref:zinc ribbon domain-containing protein n=1 Tax=Clostridium sp. TaxID=1506 RepID=UPI003EE4BACB
MFCLECGKELNENEKICPNCKGNNIEALSIYEKALTSGVMISKNDTKIKENKIMIEFENTYIELNKNADKTVLFDAIKKLGEKYSEDFMEGFNKEFKDFYKMLEYLNKDILAKYFFISDTIKEKGDAFGYKDFSKKFEEKMNTTEFKIYPILNYLKVVYEDGTKKIEEKEEERSLRKENRTKYYADENGSLTEKVSVEAKNKTMGVLHSLLNSAMNTKTNIEVKKDFRKIYEDKDRRNKIKLAIKEDVEMMTTIALDILNNVYNADILESIYSEEDKTKAINYYINLGNMETDEEKIECIKNSIQSFGEFEGIYIDAMALYPKGLKGLSNICKFFYLDEESLKVLAEKRRDEIKKLNSIYGNKGMYIAKYLARNTIFKAYEYKFSKDFNESFNKVCKGLGEEYIYLNDKRIKDKNYNVGILALENYAFIEEGEVPLVLYNYETNYKRSLGVVITDRNIYYKNNENVPKKRIVSGLKLESLAYNTETRKIFVENESTDMFIEDERIARNVIDALSYFIVLLNYKSEINKKYIFTDEVKIREDFFNNFVELKGYKDEEKDLIEKRLKRNYLYHKVKCNFTGDLIQDINAVWREKEYKKIWDLNFYKNEKERDKLKEKLEKVKKNFVVNENDIDLVLYDDSILGIEKDCILITNSNVYSKEGILGNTITMSLDKTTDFIMKEDKIVFSNGGILSFESLQEGEKVEIKRCLEIILILIILRKMRE